MANGDLHSRRWRLWAILAAAALAAAVGAATAVHPTGQPGAEGAGAADPRRAWEVGPGTLRPVLCLTGSLRAVRSEDVLVPRSTSWQQQIRWLADDGARVQAGDPVAQLDPGQLAVDLEEQRVQVLEAELELDAKRAELEAKEEELVFDLERKRVELRKAELQASVPEPLLAGRDYHERRLELRRAQAAFAKAEGALAAHRVSAEADLAVLGLELRTAQDRYERLRAAMGAMTLRAPKDGLFLVEENPWEGRKMMPGDTLYTGMVVGRIPDLSEMEVDALLSDVDDGLAAPGQRARVVLDAHPDRVYAGHVLEVAPTAQRPSSRTQRRFFAVRVRLEASDPKHMRPGMSARVELERPRRVARLAPRRALDLAAQPTRARMAGGGWTEVRVGECDLEACEILEGLKPGDRLEEAHP